MIDFQFDSLLIAEINRLNNILKIPFERCEIGLIGKQYLFDFITKEAK